jgi:hypothetical protein
MSSGLRYRIRCEAALPAQIGFGAGTRETETRNRLLAAYPHRIMEPAYTFTLWWRRRSRQARPSAAATRYAEASALAARYLRQIATLRKKRGVCIKTYRHAEVEYTSQKIHRAVYICFKELEKAGSDLPATIDVYQVKARFPELGP